MPHGFQLMRHSESGQTDELYCQLLATGFSPWDGNDMPRFVLLHKNAAKQCWFEAGYWAGRSVPMFLVGTGVKIRNRHRDMVNRFGGWTCAVNNFAELLAMLHRRGLPPDEWDSANNATARERWLSLNEAKLGA